MRQGQAQGKAAAVAGRPPTGCRQSRLTPLCLCCSLVAERMVQGRGAPPVFCVVGVLGGRALGPQHLPAACFEPLRARRLSHLSRVITPASVARCARRQLVGSFIQTQKYSMHKTLERRFRAYLTHGEWGVLHGGCGVSLSVRGWFGGVCACLYLYTSTNTPRSCSMISNELCAHPTSGRRAKPICVLPWVQRLTCGWLVDLLYVMQTSWHFRLCPA